MQRQRRLTRDTRIAQIHRQGRSVANGLLVLRLLPNDLELSRFCVVAGKRVGNAVVRNRVKRRIREAVRHTPHHPGWDAIIMARRGSGDADYHRLRRAVHNLMRRTGMAVPSAPTQRGQTPTRAETAGGDARQYLRPIQTQTGQTQTPPTPMQTDAGTETGR